MDYDVIIIGGGAAGLSAALWCDELGLDALLLESKAELGGQLLWIYNEIKNHLGVEANDGRDLRDRFLRQIENRKFTIFLQAEIGEIDLTGKQVFLKSGETFAARFLIIATGVRRRKLSVEGEEKFKAKGIIESGKRDANLIDGKRVCVIGGGDAAFENALILAKAATEVILVHRRENFSARSDFVEQAKKNSKIKILTETVVRKIMGEERVEAIELENLNGKERFKVETQAVLIRIGVEPNTELLRSGVDLDENGYIKINQNCETNVEGVYAAGDAANPIAPTVSSAVGMGATAVKAITNYKLRITNVGNFSSIRNS